MMANQHGKAEGRWPCTVAHVLYSLDVGGAEIYAWTIARNLDRSRFRSILCGVDKGGALEADIQTQGMPCVVLHRRAGIDVALMWRLYRLFRANHVDVVHTHHFAQLFYSALGARLAGARLIHTEHCTSLYGSRRVCLALRRLARLCYRVLAIGDEVAAALTDHVGVPARKVEIVRAGVDTEAFVETRGAARRALGLGEDERVAVTVARLSPEKNHRLLLSAFAQVAEQIDTARLLIVGDGPERSAVREEIGRLGLEQRVRMLGLRRDVPRILAASDVFVLSSDREGLPIAILEAMAAGLPVVATAVGDVPWAVCDRETGRLVPAGDVVCMSEAMLHCLTDLGRTRGMGLKGRSLVAEKYSLPAIVAHLERVYDIRG